MDSTELVTNVRLAARISDSHPDYPTARLLRELTDALQTVFVRPLKAAGAGYGTQMASLPIAPGTGDVTPPEFYRIPARSVVAGLVTVEVMDPGGTVQTLICVNQRDQANLTGRPDEPRGYIDQGDQIRLVPAPSISGWTLRVWYKIRPSTLIVPQTAGLITAINRVTRQITVNAIPSDYATGSPVAITAASSIDAVSPSGSHELHLVSQSITSLVALVITLPVGTDMTRIVVGDYVRAADQSEWPMLPHEFHRTLADAAAVVVLSDVGTPEKAAALAGKVTSDVQRMVELMEPRTRDLAKPVIPRYGALRSSRLRRPPTARL